LSTHVIIGILTQKEECMHATSKVFNRQEIHEVTKINIMVVLAYISAGFMGCQYLYKHWNNTLSLAR